MLRAVRFAALLGFTIEDATWEALVENAPNITRATAPRLYEEVLKLFLSGEGERTYQLMRKSGLFSALFPEFAAWLDEESEGFPHVRLGADLEWVDRMTGREEKVSPPLLLALMFSEYLEENAQALRKSGMAPLEAMNAAVAGFLSVQAPLVAIPHRVGVAARDILALQNRLARIPGKRPQSILSRPCFGDAMSYLRCRWEITGEGEKVFSWWERYSRENVMPQVEGREEGVTARPRRRRRRRRGKPAQVSTV
jgi:poly(A) polymerase